MNSPKTHFIILYPSSPSSQADTAVPPSTVSGIVSVAAQSRVSGTIEIMITTESEPETLDTVTVYSVWSLRVVGVPVISSVSDTTRPAGRLGFTVIEYSRPIISKTMGSISTSIMKAYTV